MPWTAGVFNRANGATGWQDDAAALIPIAANRHDDQDNDFRNGINNCLTKDGSNAAIANLDMNGYRHTNVAAAVNPTDYARYDQVTSVTPVGVLLAYSGATAPTGWLLCDGSAVSRTSYGALNALYNGLSYPYGSGDGSTTFNLPDLRRRYIAGKGASDTLGFTEGGNITGTAYASRSMSHTHAVPGHYHSTAGAGSSLIAAGQTLGATSKTVTGSIGGASDGTHDHDLKQEAGGGGTADGSAANIISLVGSTVAAYRNSNNHYTGGGHSHTHVLVADISHTHAASAVSGSLGLVTGGANGDGSFNAGSTVTGSYLFLNYIVKT